MEATANPKLMVTNTLTTTLIQTLPPTNWLPKKKNTNFITKLFQEYAKTIIILTSIMSTSLATASQLESHWPISLFHEAFLYTTAPCKSAGNRRSKSTAGSLEFLVTWVIDSLTGPQRLWACLTLTESKEGTTGPRKIWTSETRTMTEARVAIWDHVHFHFWLENMIYNPKFWTFQTWPPESQTNSWLIYL